MAGTTVVFDILARDRASSKFAAVGRAADHSSSTMSKWGSRLKSSAMLGFGALAVGAVGFAKSAIDTEKQFSTSMRMIQASTHATSGDMKSMNDLAIKLGKDTVFSANDAADAMLELAKAGLDTKTIMGGGVAGTLTLAAAGGTSLANAATIASNALNTFNLRGKDMDKVAAALAGGANASSASVESLGQALSQVGPGATNAGLSLQETVAALAAFDSAGIKGSDAGTSLKTMLTRLIPSTKSASQTMEAYHLNFVKANGDFKSLTEIAGDLQKHLGKLGQAERTEALAKIFGSDATRAATVLMKEGAEGIKKYIKATNDQAAAQDMAKARMGGTAGALEQLSGSIETAKLRLGQELAPAVTAGANALAKGLVPAMEHVIEGGKEMVRAVTPAVKEIAEALSHLSGEGDGASAAFDGFVDALRVASTLVGGVVNVVDNLPGPIKEVGVQAGIVALVMPRLTAGLTTATGAIQSQITYLRVLNLEMRSATSRTALVSGAVSKMGGVIKQVAGVGGILALTSALGDASDKGASFGDVLKGAAGGAGIGAMFGPIGALIGAGAGGGLTALRGAFSQTSDEARAARLEMLRSQGFENAKKDAESLRESLAGVIHAYGGVTRAAVKSSFMGDDGKLDSDIAGLRDLGVSMDTIVSATLGQRDAIDVVNGAMNKYRGSLQTSLDFAKAQWDDVKDGAADYVSETGQVIKNGQHLDDNALDIYRKQWQDAQDALDAFLALQDIFNGRIDRNTGAIADHRKQMRGLAEDLHVPLSEYKKFPDKVRTRFESEGLSQTSSNALRLIAHFKGLQKFSRIKAIVSAPGVKLTADQILDLQKRYRLTPHQVRTLVKQEGIPASLQGIAKVVASHKKIDGKEIKTLLEITGVDATVADIKRAAKQLKDTDGNRANTSVHNDASQAFGEMGRFSSTLNHLDGNRADTFIYTHHVDTYESRGGGNGGSGASGGSGRLAPRAPSDTGIQFADKLLAAAKTRGDGGSRIFRGLGGDVVKHFVNGINGSAHDAEQAVNHMMAAIAKALKDKKITEAAAKRMRETVNEMAREADRGRAMLQKRFEFASSLKQQYADELNFSDMLQADGFSGIGSFIGGAEGLATRLRSFAGQLKELRDDGMPKSLVTEVASLGSDQGSQVAAAILSGSEDEQHQLASAFNAVQAASGALANTAADTAFGTVKQIKQEYHVTLHVNVPAGDQRTGSKFGQDAGREIEQVLVKWSREQGRPLNFKAQT